MRHNLCVTPSRMFSQSYSQHSIEIVGVDRILLSTDYPYRYRPERGARNFLAEANLSNESKSRSPIQIGNGYLHRPTFNEQFQEKQNN